MTDLDKALAAGELTLPRILLHWFRTIPHELAIREKKLGIWNRCDWVAYWDKVECFALGLKVSGFGAGDRLAIASEDTPEKLYADLALPGAGRYDGGHLPHESLV